MKLGGTRTYLTPGRLTRLPAIDCQVRGGQYTLGDLSSGSISLERWLPLAEKGDAEAQYYVARIHANGMSGVPVDYAAAANWYGRAAKQGFSSAQTELGYLYEKGLGVEQDLKRALDLQRQGAGLGEELDYAWKIAATKEQADSEIAALSARLEESNTALESLRAELGQTRDSLAASRARLATSQSAVASLRVDLEAARLAGAGADPARIRSLESDLSSREAELKNSQAKVAQLESELASRRTELDTSISSSQVTNAQLNELRTAVRDANLQVDDLRAQLEQAQLRLTDSREELSRQRDQYKREVGVLVAKQEKALAALRVKGAQTVANSAEVEVLTQQLAAANVELAARERTIASLENNTDMLSDQIKRMQEGRAADAARMRNETQRLQQQVADQRDRLEKAETEGAGLQKTLLSTQTRLALATNQLKADQTQIKSLEIEVQSQKKQLEANQAQIAALRQLVNNSMAVATPDRVTPAPRPAIAQANPDSPAQKLLTKARSLNQGTYYALVIGNTNYMTLGRLETGVPDAEAVARLLERNYNFKVKLLRDASQEDIETSLNAHSRMLKEGDSFLLYYAGRSIADKPGRESWIGVEADPSTRQGYVDSSRIQDQIELMRAKSVLVVADCCLAGTVTHARTTRLGREWDEKSFAVRFQNKARLVLTSAPDPGVVGAVNNGNLSPFAENFLQVLRGSRVVMSGQELACELGARLQQTASNNKSGLAPIYSELEGIGHGGGEFFFVPAPVSIAAAERTAAVF
jgi:septal ring factor EnvC (AmiA/AmiB activator)